MTRPTPAPKPTLAAKLVLWKQANDAVLEEMRAVVDPVHRGCGDAELVAAAARTAAILIQGVADGRQAD